MSNETNQPIEIDKILEGIDKIDSEAWAEKVHQFALTVKQKPKWMFNDERINIHLTDMLIDVINDAIKPKNNSN